ncbi:aldose 1-epimerase family protein [Glaciihabitans sp. UYNi722]|uniref:aldose 1-epimerase family protein n=1 Tax=Glaciihabitans sp. UYNi722 TaxID=3156344 RepID=UPI0033956DA4
MSIFDLDSGALSVSVNSRGAELSGLRDEYGRELLWQGGDPWHRRAPVLFPIVGRMPHDQLIHDGTGYPIGQHGFARDSEFAAERISDRQVVFTLVDTDETRSHFPFPFRLDVDFSVDRNVLILRHTVSNTGGQAFSASLGAHPAFAWPLAAGVAPDAHTLEFAVDEKAPIRRIVDGLLLPDARPTPVVGRTLQLEKSLFVEDAIIFDGLASRSVLYSAPGTPSITLDFADFPLLGVWSKSPGDFVCIEPWFGMTAPEDFEGEYDTKPAQFMLHGGESRVFTYSITIEQP